MGKTTTTTTGITVNIESNSVTTEKKTNWKTILIFVILIIAALIGGYYWGKHSVKLIPQEPIYIQGDTVRVEINCPVPVEVKEPCDTLDIIRACIKTGKYANFFPERVRDSIIYIPTSEDTLSIIRDWAAERLYEEQIFDDCDTIGSAIIKAKVQYNRLSFMGASIVPVIKEVPYIQEPKLISPFFGVGVTTNSALTVQGGLFVKDDWGGSVLYQYDWVAKKNIFGLNVMYKF